MKLSKTLLALWIISIVVMLITGIVVLYRIGASSSFFKLLFFSGYVSVIFTLMYILICYCKTCPIKFERILILIGFTIVILGFVTFIGLFNANLIWNISISIAVIYLLMIELQLIGWADIKQSIGVKITFALALSSNLFLAYIFLLKVPTQELLPFLYGASLVSILILFYGIYFYQPKKEVINV